MRPKLNSLPFSCGIAVLASGIFAVVLVSSWSPHRRFTFLAAGCSILTILGLILSALHSGAVLLFSSMRELSETRLTG